MVVLDESLRTEQAVARLLRYYRTANRETRRRGRAWYPRMREILEGIAADTGYTLEQACAVLAITSPGAQVVTNVEWTRRALESHGRTDVGRFPNQMRPKIRAVLESQAEAERVVTGPKVAAFYRAILGDSGALVLDRWAAFAGVDDHDLRVRSGGDLPADVRRILEAAYKRAARTVRRTVRDFQATVWIAAREGTPHSRWGKPLRLADIV